MVRQLGSLEGAVMRALWEQDEPRSVRDVLNEVRAEKQLAYTTVMTVLENLHRKRLVQRTKRGRAFVYVPVMSREQYTAELLGGVLSTADDPGATLLHFVQRMTPQVQEDLREALAKLDSHEHGVEEL